MYTASEGVDCGAIQVQRGQFVWLSNAGSVIMTKFPTVDGCTKLGGVKLKLLTEFDYLLRDDLAAVERAARQLNLSEEEVQIACVTVMLSVAAGAALKSEQRAAVTDANFLAVARDALGRARHKARNFL